MSVNLSTISVSDIFLLSNCSFIINGPRILCIRFLRSFINISSLLIKLEVLMIGELIEKYSSKRLIALVTALIVFFDEIPFSYLLLDSVLMPTAFEDFLMITGLKTAPSR